MYNYAILSLKIDQVVNFVKIGNQYGKESFQI